MQDDGSTQSKAQWFDEACQWYYVSPGSIAIESQPKLLKRLVVIGCCNDIAAARPILHVLKGSAVPVLMVTRGR